MYLHTCSLHVVLYPVYNRTRWVALMIQLGRFVGGVVGWLVGGWHQLPFPAHWGWINLILQFRKLNTFTILTIIPFCLNSLNLWHTNKRAIQVNYRILQQTYKWKYKVTHLNFLILLYIHKLKHTVYPVTLNIFVKQNIYAGLIL